MCLRPYSLLWALLLLTFHPLADGAEVWSWFPGEKIGTNHPDPAAGSITLPEGGEVAVGSGSQWRFFAFTNDIALTNVLFATIPAPSSLPATTNSPFEPDLDLYASTNADLWSLTADSVSNAWKSLARGGRETICLTDAPTGAFYVAVKCESSVETEFSLLAIASDTPFSEVDPSGRRHLRGVPLPAPIPDASARGPGVAFAVAFAPESFPVHRVIASETVEHERFADLVTLLDHKGVSVTLAKGVAASPGTTMCTWDDSDQGDIPGSIRTTGPGSLTDFAGQASAGQWLLTQQDVVPGGVGTNLNFALILEQEDDLNAGATRDLEPGSSTDLVFSVPLAATNLTLTVGLVSGSGPIRVDLSATDSPDAMTDTKFLNPPETVVVITKDKYSEEPLNAVRYSVRLRNEGVDRATTTIQTSVMENPAGPLPVHFGTVRSLPIPDERVTTARLNVPNAQRVATVSPAVRIRHPRISDLELTLISPSGTRVLLSDQRGGISTEGMGSDSIVTNVVPVSASGGPLATTNVMDVGESAGTVSIQYNFLELPDVMHVYRGITLIFDSGMVSGSGIWTIPFGPDDSEQLTIVMNEGNNYDPDTAWDYTVTSTRPGYQYVAFIENHDGALPIKFAPPPFTNTVPAALDTGSSSALWLVPEQCLRAFTGELATGDWKLEVADRRDGPAGGDPALLSWGLDFVFEDATPAPYPLAHEIPRSSVIPAGGWQHFAIEIPPWAERTTNTLISAQMPLQLWFSLLQPPTSTNQSETLLASNIQSSSLVLSATSMPPIFPGTRYYLGLQNTNSVPVPATFQVSYDVPQLTAGVPATVGLSAADAVAYYGFDVSTNADAVVVRLSGLTGELELVARKELPFPTAENYQFGSFNPDSLDEEIVINRGTTPTPLTPGRWYLGVLNPSLKAAQAVLLFQEYAPPISIAQVLPGPTGIQLTWEGPAEARFQVQWSTSLTTPSWKPFSATVSSTTGTFSFLDDGTETGGFAEPRFYRLLRVP